MSFVPTFFKTAARHLMQKHALIRNELASKLYHALKDMYETEPQEIQETPAPEQLEALLEGEGVPQMVMPPGTIPPAASTPIAAAPALALQQRE